MKKAIVNSLPKSGTNLLAKCLNLFGYRERGHISAGTILDRRPLAMLRRYTWQPGSDNYLLGVNSPVKARKSAVERYLRRVRDNQFITSHVGYESDLLDYVIQSGFQPIQVIRDPRAVLASFVPYILYDKHHFLHDLYIAMSEEERYQATLEGITHNNLSLKPLKTCCIALDPWLDNVNTHCIRFEDIIGTAGGGSDDARLQVINELARILGAPIEKAPDVANELFGPGRHTFRKGKVDSWRDEIPDPILEHITTELAVILAKWGYQV